MAAGLIAPSPQEEKTGGTASASSKLKAGRSLDDDVEILVGHLVGEYSLVGLMLDAPLFLPCCSFVYSPSFIAFHFIPFGTTHTRALVNEHQPSRLTSRGRSQCRVRAPSGHLRDTGR